MPSFTRLRVVLPFLAIAALGAGCALPFGQKDTATPSTATMRQPAPPAPPTEEPVIPPEAANVPRPY